MKLHFFLVVFYILGMGNSYAQQSLYLNGQVVFPGMQVEYNINPKHSLIMSTYYYPSIYYSSPNWFYNNSIMVEFQYRNYYNLQKRVGKGLNINNNEANYFFAGIKAISQTEGWNKEGQKFGAGLNLGWGFKRFIGDSKWYYGLELGIFTPLDKDVGRPIIAPHISVKAGYLLYSKKAK